jgi:hypothetical protein
MIVFFIYKKVVGWHQGIQVFIKGKLGLIGLHSGWAMGNKNGNEAVFKLYIFYIK